MTQPGCSVTQDSPSAASLAPLPTRAFGRDGAPIPVLGLGGQSLIQRATDDERAVELISRALDLGVRYIDTAPLYGESERRIGLAIRGRRSEAFLATKTAYRRGSSARRSLERSLALLGTDSLDLYQLHCFMHECEIRAAFARGGVIAMLEKAREEGLVRRVGITGHYRPELLSELLRRYPFDSVLMPVNPADPLSGSFIRDTLPVAQQTGASVIAMKVMGAGYLTHRGLDARGLLRYALSAPVSVAIVSCRHIRDLEANVETASAFRPLEDEQMRAMEGTDEGLLAACNRIYKRHRGRRGLKIALRNRLAAQASTLLPGWWHL